MLASTLITLALAEYASRDDFQQIGKGSKIRHGIQWLFRAAVVALACYLDDCMLYAVPLAFLFSAVFRWRLNKMRGKDWRYVAPWSAVYDCWWVTLILHIEARQWNPMQWTWPKAYHIMAWNAFYQHGSPLMRQRIHRAGTMAYIFEAVCFVAGTVWYIWA